MTPLVPLCDLLYCRASNLFSTVGVLASTNGVRQGCVLGPLLFCLAVQDILREVKQRFPLVTTSGYMDDFNLASLDCVQLQSAFEFIRTEAAKIGLHIRKDKTYVFGPHGASCAAALGIEHAPHGVRVLGGWVGPESAVQAFLDLRCNETQTLFDSIGECDPEVAFAILRMCAHPTWNFVSRVHPDTLRGSSNFDDRALAAFRKIAQLPDDYAFSEEQLILLHLPIAQGGLGLRQYQRIAAGNFLASANPDGDDQETRTTLIDEALLKQIENSSNPEMRLHHAACKKRHSGAWLAGPSFSFSFGRDFAPALQLRIAAFAKWGPSKTAHTCSCKYMSRSPAEAVHHHLGCTKRQGSLVSTRHMEIELLHARMLRALHIGHRLNPPLAGHLFGDLEILTCPGSNDVLMVVDYTVTSSLSKYGGSSASATEKKMRSTSPLGPLYWLLRLMLWGASATP